VSDGSGVVVYKDLGLVSQVFDEPTLASLRGHLAIGHTRYSTDRRLELGERAAHDPRHHGRHDDRPGAQRQLGQHGRARPARSPSAGSRPPGRRNRVDQPTPPW
jgi:hypothetical protein